MEAGCGYTPRHTKNSKIFAKQALHARLHDAMSRFYAVNRIEEPFFSPKLFFSKGAFYD
jgi:hypothetical protein